MRPGGEKRCEIDKNADGKMNMHRIHMDQKEKLGRKGIWVNFKEKEFNKGLRRDQEK